MSNFVQDCGAGGTGAAAVGERAAPSRWVDVYDGCNFAGNRRRFFAPARIDRVMWAEVRRGVPAEQGGSASLASAISVRLGGAGVRLRVRGPDGVATELSSDVAALNLNDALALEIVAASASAQARDAA